jgi:hypothetical protein
VAVRNTNPLHAWLLVLLTVGTTFLIWLIGEPIRQMLMDGLYGQMPTEAIAPLNILNTCWFGIPIIVSVLITIWAFLATTKRQVVINPGGYYE